MAQLPEPVTAELIDELVERIPDHDLRQPVEQTSDVDRLMARMSVELNSRDAPHAMHFARPEPDTDLDPAQPLRPANDTPDLPRLSDPELARIRAALYSEAEEEDPRAQSAQMRLAIHAMNATMMVVFMPVAWLPWSRAAPGREPAL